MRVRVGRIAYPACSLLYLPRDLCLHPCLQADAALASLQQQLDEKRKKLAEKDKELSKLKQAAKRRFWAVGATAWRCAKSLSGCFYVPWPEVACVLGGALRAGRSRHLLCLLPPDLACQGYVPPIKGSAAQRCWHGGAGLDRYFVLL